MIALQWNIDSSNEYGVGDAVVDISVLFVSFILAGGGVGCIMSYRKVSRGWIGVVTEVLWWWHGVTK